MNENEKIVTNYIKEETLRIKGVMEQKLNKIDSLLDAKLEDLEKTTKDEKETTEVIKRKEENLKWLEGIQKRVEDLVKF